MSDCRHDTIVTWGTQDNRLWACAFCSRRFYPACETCVDVGHRNETHPAAPQPDTALTARDPKPDWDALARLVDAAIRREEITASRGAEIMGLRLQTWRDWVRDLRALGEGVES